jgi:hypothetical protein
MRAQDAFAAKGEGQQIIPDEGSLGSHTRRGLRMTLGKPLASFRKVRQPVRGSRGSGWAREVTSHHTPQDVFADRTDEQL